MEALITKHGSGSKAPASTGSDAGELVPAEPDLAWRSERLKQAQARLLLDGNRLAALLTLIAAPVLAYLLKDSVPRPSLSVWVGIIVAIAVIRFTMLSLRPYTAAAGKRHHLKLTLLLWNGLSGLAWGSTAVLAYPQDSLPHLVLLLLVLAGVVAIAVTVHSAMLGAVVAFTLPATLPIIARLISEGSPLHDQLAMLSGLFLLFTLIIAYKMHHLTLRGMLLGVYNIDLIDHLNQAKREADKLNTELRREITERRNIEARLRQERDFISGILDTENAIVVVVDLDARILRFNRAGEAATGYYAHELIGKTLWETLLPEAQVANFKRHLDAVASGIFPSECEIKWRGKDGGTRLVQLSNTAILGSNGKCTHMISTGIDITDRRMTEAALVRTRENFELLVEGVTDYAIYMLDRDGAIVSWNVGAERISGYSASEVIGAHFSEFFSPDEPRKRESHVELRIAAVDGLYQREGWYLRRDGSRLWATLTINPVRGNGNELRGFSVIINDISERKKSESALAESRELLRSLSSHLQTVREEEKAGLARELHDELGSMLTSLKIEISSLKQQLAQDLDATHARIDAIVDTVHEAITTTRRISTDLRPPILDNLGLLPAIEWQLEQFKQRTGMEVDLHITNDSTILGNTHTIAIFRILQEGLTNIIRHAGATRVSVAIAIDGQYIAMDIIDDGIGFSVDEHKTGGHYGLYSMQERARALGGTVDIISQPGEGTRLKVRVPVSTPGGHSSGV